MCAGGGFEGLGGETRRVTRLSQSHSGVYAVGLALVL